MEGEPLPDAQDGPAGRAEKIRIHRAGFVRARLGRGAGSLNGRLRNRSGKPTSLVPRRRIVDAGMPGMIRTAFTLPDRHRSTGGYQYFINLFRALHKYGGGKVRPVVFVGEEVEAAALAPIEDGAAEIVRSADFSVSKTRSRLANALLSGNDRRAAGTYRKHAIEVVFESARYHGWRFPFPTIAWLPDFQHRCLPGMFSRGAWLQREIGFRAQIATARMVMLSSESSRADCERFYAGSRGRIRVVPFAAELPPEARLTGV